MSENQEHETDLLADYFEKSASAVRHTFGRFEKNLVRPASNYVLLSFHKRPIFSTFITFYLALSALPVLSFIGFSIFIMATSIFVALATAITIASCAVGFFGFWLACTLIVFLFFSLNLTLSALATYLLVQFVLRARQAGSRAAFSGLAENARAQFALSRGGARGRKASVRPLGENGDRNGEAEGGKLNTKLHHGEEAQDGEGEMMVIVGVGSTDTQPTSPATSTNAFGEKVPGEKVADGPYASASPVQGGVAL